MLCNDVNAVIQAMPASCSEARILRSGHCLICVWIALQAANGLRVYFDKALHQFLLYDHELEECEKVGSLLTRRRKSHGTNILKPRVAFASSRTSATPKEREAGGN